MISLAWLKVELSNFAHTYTAILAYGWRITEKGHGQVTWAIFNFDAHNHISGTADARVAKFVRMENISIANLGMSDFSLADMVSATWPVF